MRKMKQFVLFTLLHIASCGGPTRPQQPPASNVEIDGAWLKWTRCVIPEVKRLDDNKSDAATIAQAVNQICQPQLGSWLELTVQGLSRDDTQESALRQSLLTSEALIAERSVTTAVLNLRASGKPSNQK